MEKQDKILRILGELNRNEISVDTAYSYIFDYPDQSPDFEKAKQEFIKKYCLIELGEYILPDFTEKELKSDLDNLLSLRNTLPSEYYSSIIQDILDHSKGDYDLLLRQLTCKQSDNTEDDKAMKIGLIKNFLEGISDLPSDAEIEKWADENTSKNLDSSYQNVAYNARIQGAKWLRDKAKH